MTTLEVLGLILIGIAMGFILTKGYQLHKSIKEESERSRKALDSKGEKDAKNQ